MTYYLMTFPSAAMQVPVAELPAVSADAHAVIHAAQAAGVYVFSGGIDELVPPVLVGADGPTDGPVTALDGGFAVFDLPTRAEAEQWAARLAAACRCPQELREFMPDPDR